MISPMPGGLPPITATRSPSRMASSMSWVTKMIVVRCWSQMSSRNSCIRSRVIASSAPNGSSISSSDGREASARANAARCCMPPDSSCGNASPNPARPTRSSSAAASASSSGSSRSCSRGGPLRPRAEQDVVPGGEPAEQHRRLEEHAPVGGRAGDRPSPDRDGALVGGQRPRDDPQQGRLAAAGRAEQADQLAGPDPQAGPGQRHRPAAAPAEGLADRVDHDLRAGGGCRRRGSARSSVQLGQPPASAFLMNVMSMCGRSGPRTAPRSAVPGRPGTCPSARRPARCGCPGRAGWSRASTAGPGAG